MKIPIAEQPQLGDSASNTKRVNQSNGLGWRVAREQTAAKYNGRIITGVHNYQYKNQR
jgi:hypothetical protein